MHITAIKDVALNYVQSNSKDANVSYSDIFDFPTCTDFKPWLENELSNFCGWIHKSGRGIYNKIIERELKKIKGDIPSH